MSPREAILSRIRCAVAGVPSQTVPHDYRFVWDTPLEGRIERLRARLDQLGVTVLHVAEEAEIAACAEARLTAKGVDSVLIPLDLPPAWWPVRPAVVVDSGQGPHALDEAQGVMTGCACAIAETGTIVLDSGPSQGRRAISLIPDYYLCVVRAEQVLGIVPEAIACLQEAVEAGRPITFITGPSATADIELSRVVGVHGPRTLDVLLVGG